MGFGLRFRVMMRERISRIDSTWNFQVLGNVQFTLLLQPQLSNAQVFDLSRAHSLEYPIVRGRVTLYLDSPRAPHANFHGCLS